MPGQHKGHPTIAFRPSAWQKAPDGEQKRKESLKVE